MEALRELGLTEYETAVYEALLSLGSSSGGSISKKSSVPHGKTYEALHSLSTKGLITILPTKPQTFRAIPPKEGIKRLIANKINKLSLAGDRAIRSLKKEPEAKLSAHEKIEVYSGVEKQYEVANRFAEEAKAQILVYSVGEKIPTQLYYKFKRAANNGIDMRMVAYRCDDINLDALTALSNSGLKMRYLPAGEFTLVIKDNDEVMQVVKNPNNPKDRIVILLRDKAIVSAMTSYFESIWKKAQPLRNIAIK